MQHPKQKGVCDSDKNIQQHRAWLTCGSFLNAGCLESMGSGMLNWQNAEYKRRIITQIFLITAIMELT